MQRVDQLKYILPFLFLSLIFSCKKSDDPFPEPPVIGTSPPPITYFGFTLIDTYWDDPTDSDSKTNYADEVHSFSNLADILVYDPSQDISNNLHIFDSLEMKAMLHLNEIFFEVVGTNAPSGTEYTLRTDYQSRWNQFVLASDLANNADKVSSFYIGEEPSWNGISATELKSACDLVDAQFPNIAISIVEAYPAIDDLIIPESADWIGFDHYFVKNPNTDSQYQQELEVLQNKIGDNQNLLVVMDAHYIDWAHGNFGGIQLSEMDDVAENYRTLAYSQPNTIGIIAYFWPSGFDDPNAIGARAMPTYIQEKYEEIGKAITGKP